MDCQTDLMLLNTLFLFRLPLAYHTICVNAISLADVLCQRLQIYCIAVRFEYIPNNGNALNGYNTQARPHCDIVCVVASLLNHNSTASECPIAHQL